MPSETKTYPTGSLLADEIAQQPAVWPTTLQRVKAHVKAHRPAGLEQAPNIIFTGAGTSAYAASAISEAWPAARAIPTTDLLLDSLSHIRATLPSIESGGLLVSLARSGDSPESAAVVQRFQRLLPAVQHLALICNQQGRLAALPGVESIHLDPRTNDRSLAMTGSFTNLVLGGLALFREKEIAAELPAISTRVEQSLASTSEVLEDIAHACRDRVVILASSMQALTREAALKIIELSAGRVMAMPETFLGFRHGALGFLREDTPVLCFLSSDPQTRRYEEDMIENLTSRKLGRPVIIGDASSPYAREQWFLPANAPALPDALRTPFEIVFAQLLAWHLSVHVGINPDNPSPDGVITRVVRPFRIHE